MNYAEIKTYDIANGPGVRVSFFVSGCTHHCKNCFNEIAWDFNYGEEFTEEIQDYILEAVSPIHYQGLSLLGGEPMEPNNQRGLLPLVKAFKEKFPNKNLWVYTGYVYEDLIHESRARCEVTDELLSYIDVLVDGKFVEELKDITLRFKGSSNQRIIDMPQTLKEKEVVLSPYNNKREGII